MVEQRSPKPSVAGSIPVSPASSKKETAQCAVSFSFLCLDNLKDQDQATGVLLANFSAKLPMTGIL